MHKLLQHGSTVDIYYADSEYVTVDFVSKDNADWFVKANQRFGRPGNLRYSYIYIYPNKYVVETDVDLTNLSKACGDLPTYLLIDTVLQKEVPLSDTHVKCIKEFVKNYPKFCFVDYRLYVEHTLGYIYRLLNVGVPSGIVQGVLATGNIKWQKRMFKFLIAMYSNTEYQKLAQARMMPTTVDATISMIDCQASLSVVNSKLCFLLETLELAKINHNYYDNYSSNRPITLMEQVNPMLYHKAANFCKGLENSSLKTVLLFCRMIAPQLFNDGLPDTLAIEYYLD